MSDSEGIHVKARARGAVGLALGLSLTAILAFLPFGVLQAVGPESPSGTVTRSGRFPGLVLISLVLPFVIVAGSAAVAGFVSSDWRIGLFAGALCGLVVFPVSQAYRLSLSLSTEISFIDVLAITYPRRAAAFVLDALVGCGAGTLAAFVGARLMKPRVKENTVETSTSGVAAISS